MTSQTVNYLKIIQRWKKPLFIVLAISLLMSVVFSGPRFIKPLYRSTAVLYPINIFTYSDESPTEQMLQLLESKDLHMMVVESLDLYRHYKIDRDAAFAQERILKKFNSRFTVRRTQYESVKIDTYDRFPKIAYQMALHVIDAYNELSLHLLRKKAQEVLVIREELYFSKLQEVDSLKALVDTLIHDFGLAEYNILRESMRGSYQYLSTSGKTGEPIQVLSAKSLDLFFNQRLLEGELNNLMELKKNYELAMSDVHKNLLFADVVSEPAVAQKKSYPIRWLIVLLSTFSCMVCAFIVVLILDRKIKDK